MFFQLGVHDISRSDLGWILSKHPENSFIRDAKKGRGMEATWTTLLPTPETKEEKEEVVYYSYKGKNNPVHFMEILKQGNSANYIHPSISSVSPYNLYGFRETFRTTMAKKYDEQCKRHSDKFRIEAVIGPWPFDLLRVECRFAEVGIKVTAHPSLDRTTILETPSMRVDEFLQKVYCVAYVLTERITALGREEMRVSLTSYINDWFGEVKDFRLRRRLTQEPDPQKRAELRKQLKEQADKEFAQKEKERAEKAAKEKEAPEEDEDEEEEEEGEEGEEKKGDDEDSIMSPPVNTDSDNVTVGKKKLHERRHELILEWLASLYPTKKETPRILDFGCGRGHLTVEMANLLTEATFVAMDANPWVGKNRAMKAIKRISYACANLLFPPNPSNIMNMDVLVCCEVIEHFEEIHREQLMKIIIYLVRPKHLMLTSPNIAFNPFIPNMKTPFRHPDHKIEYTYEEWNKEVLKPLQAAGYKVTEHKLLPEEETQGGEAKGIQPSFIVSADLIPDWKPVWKRGAPPPVEKLAAQLNAQLSGMMDPLWLPLNQIIVDHKKLNLGYSSMQYITHANGFFAAAPTMAPVDYREPSLQEGDSEEDKMFLEHPETAFSYYASMGLTKVVAEKKYMGSRAQILAYRSDKCPKDQKPIRIITRNGAPFFGDDVETPLMLHKELDEQMKVAGYDWIILDGEMLPWSLKAGKMILDTFRKPAECALISRKIIYGEESTEYKRALEFMQALEHHTQQTPLEYRIFQIMAAGRINKLGTMEHSFLGDYIEAQKRYDLIKQLESEHIKSVEYRFVDLTSAEDQKAAVSEWKEYCAGGGEGWVVKAYPIILPQCDKEGRLMLPMVKVRGREYLRLVYGIDYLEPKYFKEVSKRKIGPKRAVARKQIELADTILKCFIHGHYPQRMKAVAAFYGAADPDINATL